MIKRIFSFCFSLLLITNCNEGLEAIDISKENRNTRFERFDSAFFNLDTANFQDGLATLKLNYSPFFASNGTERFWLYQRNDNRQKTLYKEVEQVINPFKKQNKLLNNAMKRWYQVYPNEPTITFYSYISNLDFSAPTFYNDSVNICFVATDLYLGSNQPFYGFLPNYISYERSPNFMVRDAMESLIYDKLDPSKGDGELLKSMIQHGKLMYILEQLLPEYSKYDIIKYPKEKLDFCIQNEKQIWSYFIENQLLFSNKERDKKRFLELAPFTKFGMKFDSQSPGRVGQWIGWQIVRNYMQANPGISISDLANENDSRKILKLSAYKP